MNLYFSTNPKQNKICVANKDWFCVSDRIAGINWYCEEYGIIEKIRKNEDGYFDFSKTLIDVGAEDGNYSILLDFKENYCFEPNKHMCCLIYTNMFMRDKVCNTHVFNCGCGEKEEDVAFNGFAQEGSGYYNQSCDRLLDNSYGVMHKITIDSLNIQNVGLLKTDTEGFDLEVLKGSVETIKNNNYPPILFELWDVGKLGTTQENHDEMSNFLTDLGYTILWHWGDHETHLAVKKKMKTCVLAIAKLENNYIREWVEHYKNLGFSNVIIYDNNDVYSERVSETIEDYIKSGFAIVEPLFGICQAQRIAYQNGYNKYGGLYDWIAVFDIDEYLFLNEQYDNNIEKYLSCGMFDKADIIRVPWKFFDDNDLVSVVNNDYSIVNRFTRPVAVEKQCNWTKAIIRGGLKLFIPDDNDSIPHLVNVDGVKYAVDANGNQNRNMSIRDSCDYSNCQLNHYSTKTIEEFVLNKIKKGYATSVDANILNKKYFFNFNTYTKEKEDLYNNLTKKNVDIFIFTHKNFETERTNSIYKIVCNKNDDISSDSLEVIKLDCELSNIGFSEWQKMYELYKQEQVKLNDYVGLAHYHRFLKFCDDVNIVPDIKQFFEKYDILDKPPVNLGNLREQYKRSHNVKDFDLAFDILKEMHPELHGKIDKVVNNGVLFDSNIMIMKKADFLSLCEFVFPVLFEYCKRVGIDRTSDESFFDYKNKHISEYMKFHKQGDYNFDEQARICSYLAERIATVFLFTNFNNIGILPMVEK